MAPRQRLPARATGTRSPSRRRGSTRTPPGWPGPRCSRPRPGGCLRRYRSTSDQARVPAADPAAGAARPRLGRAVRAADPVSTARRYRRYCDVIESLAAPAVFENRPIYRLVSADLTGAEPRLGFARGRFFEGINVGGPAAFEYAAAALGVTDRRAYREAFGDPTNLDRPLGRDGDVRADPALRPGDGHRDVPDALPRPGPGRPRGRAVPGDPGRHLPAVGRGGLERGERLRPLARPAPRVRRGAAWRVRGVRKRGRADRLPRPGRWRGR